MSSTGMWPSSKQYAHNITKKESAVNQTEDKGVILVIMDKDMYSDKCMALLDDENVRKECRDQVNPFQSSHTTAIPEERNLLQIQETLHKTLSTT